MAHIIRERAEQPECQIPLPTLVLVPCLGALALKRLQLLRSLINRDMIIK